MDDFHKNIDCSYGYLEGYFLIFSLLLLVCMYLEK